MLADLVVGLKPGEISQPLHTPSGYHLVRLNEIRGADQQVVIEQTHARHILLKPTEIQDDATVRQRLLRHEQLHGIRNPGSESVR